MDLQNISGKYPISELDIHFIYCIENIENEMFYIGLTNDLNKRISTHLYQLETKTHINKNMQSDFVTFGKEKFVVSIICTARSREEAFFKERNYISELNKSNKLYNSILYTGDITKNKIEIFEASGNLVELYTKVNRFREIIKERKLDITNIVNVLIPTDYLNPYKEEHTKIMISFLYLDRYIDNEQTIYDKYINLMKRWCNAKRPNENQFIYEFINWLNHLIHFYESM